jgi:hypothetical protein
MPNFPPSKPTSPMRLTAKFSPIHARFSFCVILSIGMLGVANADDRAETGASFSTDRFRAHVQFLASDQLAGRAPGSAGAARAREYITKHFTASQLRPIAARGSWLQEFALAGGNASDRLAFNILGSLPGSGRLKAEAVVVCAHYDHLGRSDAADPSQDTIFNGASDNASGVAALLMITEYFSAKRLDPVGPRRTLIFACFDGEELGLKGAQHYAANPPWPLEKTAAVINLDDIGHLRGGTVYASDAESSAVLSERCRRSASQWGLTAETWLSGHHRSDHAVFLSHQIPAVHVFTGLHRHYHRVSDEWVTINHEGGAQVARFAGEIVEQLAVHDGAIAYRDPPLVQDLSFALGIVRTIGVIPNLGPQDDEPPRILFVVPGSPAANQGLRSGDQIANLDGFELKRPEDALRAIQQLNPRDGVSLSVIREDARVEILLPPNVFDRFAGPQIVPLPNGNCLVTFVYAAEKGVRRVFLAGDFNDWGPTSLAMTGPDDAGNFTTQLELEQGIYRYKFVVEGERWIPDPTNMFRAGKHDNSILRVGGKSRGDANGS